MADETTATLRRCIGSARFGIEPHEAPAEEFPRQPSQKDGLGRMRRTDWNAYTAGLARDAQARRRPTEGSDTASPALWIRPLTPAARHSALSPSLLRSRRDARPPMQPTSRTPPLDSSRFAFPCHGPQAPSRGPAASGPEARKGATVSLIPPRGRPVAPVGERGPGGRGSVSGRAPPSGRRASRSPRLTSFGASWPVLDRERRPPPHNPDAPGTCVCGHQATSARALASARAPPTP